MNRFASFRLALSLAAAALAAGAARADFVAPSATVNGHLQNDLAAAWWQWSLSYPASANPMLDSTGSLASLGSQGNVFFLAGYAGPPNQGGQFYAARGVSPNSPVLVLNTQALFFPVLNTIISTEDGQPLNQLRSGATSLLGNLVPSYPLYATLKNLGTGQTTTLTQSDLLAYRQTAGPFPITLGANNAYGAPPGTYQFATDGYYVGINPLPVGNYQITFGGQSDGAIPADLGGGDFPNQQTIVYDITSTAPEPASWLLALTGVTGAWMYRRGRRTARVAALPA